MIEFLCSERNISIIIETILTRLENYHLTVNLVKEEDGGEYEVKAENEMGSVSTKSTVTVHSEYNNTTIDPISSSRERKVRSK